MKSSTMTWASMTTMTLCERRAQVEPHGTCAVMQLQQQQQSQQQWHQQRVLLDCNHVVSHEHVN